MSLTKWEQETIIRWDEEGEQAEIYTASARVAARLEKLGVKPYRTASGPSWFFMVSRGAVRVKVGNKSSHIAGGKPEAGPGETPEAADDGEPDKAGAQQGNGSGKICACGKEFIPTGKRQKYCDLCASQKRADRNRKYMANTREKAG